jgi:hypothetical protein
MDTVKYTPSFTQIILRDLVKRFRHHRTEWFKENHFSLRKKGMQTKRTSSHYDFSLKMELLYE